MKKIILITGLILLCSALYAQVKPYIINTTGKSAQYSSGYVAYSVGEAIVGPMIGANYKMNQGFLQGDNSFNKGFTLKLFLEGLYAGSGIMRQAQNISGAQFGDGISENITVELHEAFAPYNLAYTFEDVMLNINGNVTINNLSESITGLYYVAVKSRNSIETWSNTPINIYGINPIICNFTSAVTQAFGNNLKLMSDNVFALYGGDANQDGLVDGGDMSEIDNANVAVRIGYYPEDINGDGLVDGGDMAIIDNNSVAVVFAKSPW